MPDRRRRAHFLWSVVIVFLIQLPLLLYNTAGVAGALTQLAAFAVAAVAVGLIYIGLIKHLHADRQGPVPWYASPVVWLGLPTLTLLLYALMGRIFS